MHTCTLISLVTVCSVWSCRLELPSSVAFPFFYLQMQVAELLVSHGASLNARTYLDETPIGKLLPLTHSITLDVVIVVNVTGKYKCIHCTHTHTFSLSV